MDPPPLASTRVPASLESVPNPQRYVCASNPIWSQADEASRFLSPQPSPASNADFHLDTHFNPVWMSGPHVFSCAKDQTVVHAETYSEKSYPRYRRSATSSSGRGDNGAGAVSYSPFVIRSTPIRDSKASVKTDKPWKNIAITEQDDAEFEVVQAEAEVRALAEAKSRLVGLVSTWPPKLKPASCAECEVLLGPQRRVIVETTMGPRVGAEAMSAGTNMQDNVVPALSYGSSGESESESEVFKVVPGRRAVGQEVSTEKSVGFGGVERKAPAAALTGAEEGEGENRWARFGAPLEEVGKNREASVCVFSLTFEINCADLLAFRIVLEPVDA